MNDVIAMPRTVNDNSLQIKPLFQYDVYFDKYGPYGEMGDDEVKDTFTAESHDVHEGRVRFYRTGHTIREYFRQPTKLIVTPVVEG